MAATVLRALSAYILLPYAEAVPIMREAVDAITKLDDDELLQYGAISVALTSALWDANARRECLERPLPRPGPGSLRVLDLTLWTMSLAELKGGTPRRAAPARGAGARTAPRDGGRRGERHQRRHARLGRSSTPRSR